MINSSMSINSPRCLKVFICYACKNGVVLTQHLQAELRTAGFDAWLDAQSFAHCYRGDRSRAGHRLLVSKST